MEGFFRFIYYLCVCACASLCAPNTCSAQEGHKKALDSLELEFQVARICLIWVLWTKPGLSPRAISAPDVWAVEFICLLCVYKRGCAYATIHVRRSENNLLPSAGHVRLGHHHSWWPVSLPPEPSCQPSFSSFLKGHGVWIYTLWYSKCKQKNFYWERLLFNKVYRESESNRDSSGNVISTVEKVTSLPIYLNSTLHIPFGKETILLLGQYHIIFCFISEMSTWCN